MDTEIIALCSSLLYQSARIFARAMIFAYLATSRPKNTPGSSGVK